MTQTAFPRAGWTAPPEFLAVDDTISLRLSTPETVPEMFEVFEANRERLLSYSDDADTLTLDKAIDFAVTTRDIVQHGHIAQYELLTNGVINGEVSLFRLNDVSATVGYWREDDGRREGIVTKATSRLIEYGFTGWNLEQVFFDIVPGNVKSEAVAQRLGAVLTDRMVRRKMPSGRELRFQTWELSR